MMEKNSKIYVAGHRGMVGSAIVRELQRQGYTNIVTRTHKELDLCRQEAVEKFFAEEKPEYVFLAAAKVGGIVANQNALADFMYDNMILEMNVIHAAWKNGVKKLEFLGSSCIYPRMAPQPMTESCLLTGELEKTNEAYALAKISGLKYCEFLNRQYGTDYISVMPTNLYGPNDNYHPEHSHVLPALIRRFHEAKVSGAKSVTCWGTGSPLREFLYVDDLANLCVFLMNNYSGDETVNAGTGKELTIKELTELVAKVIGYEGKIEWDSTRPDGTPRKLLDVSKATKLGWTYKVSYADYCRDLVISKSRNLENRKFVILRHDVDLKAPNSLKTAQIEHSLGARASYYFRIIPESNQPQIIRSIAQLGHEIGYHYEDMSLCNGNIDQAWSHFQTWLNYFRQYYAVETICMHGAPTSKYDSKDLWQKYDYKTLGIVGEPYMDTDFSDVFYLTDTGRCWDGYKVSVRDKIPSYQDEWTAKGLVWHTTQELIAAVEQGKLPNHVMITTHPQRWTNNKAAWYKEWLLQSAKNIVKRIIVKQQ